MIAGNNPEITDQYLNIAEDDADSISIDAYIHPPLVYTAGNDESAGTVEENPNDASSVIVAPGADVTAASARAVRYNDDAGIVQSNSSLNNQPAISTMDELD